ncbi:MAG: hypothetical protein QXI58_04405 [Candidatus Micrarchaeia archaeon]
MSLEELTRKFVKISMEKALYNTLKETAPELPKEVINDIYKELYKPVMVAVWKKLLEVVK